MSTPRVRVFPLTHTPMGSGRRSVRGSPWIPSWSIAGTTFCRDGLARAKKGSMIADCRVFSIQSLKLNKQRSSHKTLGMLILLLNYFYNSTGRSLGKPLPRSSASRLSLTWRGGVAISTENARTKNRRICVECATQRNPRIYTLSGYRILHPFFTVQVPRASPVWGSS